MVCLGGEREERKKTSAVGKWGSTIKGAKARDWKRVKEEGDRSVKVGSRREMKEEEGD